MNAEKERQLGMKIGTANHILTRKMLFCLAVKCGMDVCVKCGNKIVSPDDLSKEHKVDWLHSDDPKKLFFDVENVAFSHKKCNVRGRQRGKKAGAYFRKGRKKQWESYAWNGNGAVFLGSFLTQIEAQNAFEDFWSLTTDAGVA